MVVGDRLSKYAYFVPIRHPFTASTVAREFISNIFHLDGVPLTIVSDLGKVFISSFGQALFKLKGTVFCMSSSYHPQSDGQIEIVNRILEQYLRYFVSEKSKKWEDWSITLRLLPYIPGTTQPYRQSSMVSRSLAKLSPRFFSPYKILANLGSIAYRLELPQGSLVHNMFHVSLLWKSEGPVPKQSTLSISEPSKSRAELQPERILEERVVEKGKYRPKTEILVQWEGQSPENTTWENKWHFPHTFPQFHLEDKGSSSGVDCYMH
ncbi:uncharacterized protein LOC141666105 [Apium graveolens]|uniref:uncharacterized protein LOC141666105 n=1 Tax=Apium graveolens TaxID=4045 RepID=UPI003D79C806